jgi:diguanylate cyclase (GGDEF)-like protein/excisionase family DNA binding protein
LTTALPPRPIDATLSVTKAARLLGVHPNTVRAWSDAGRLRYYRINPRGDRRYRLGDLQRFLAAAASGAPDGVPPIPQPGRRGARLTVLPGGERPERGGPGHARPVAPIREDGRDADRDRRVGATLDLLATLVDLAARARDVETTLVAAARTIRERGAFGGVAIFEAVDGRLVPRAVAAGPGRRVGELPRAFGVLGRLLEADRADTTATAATVASATDAVAPTVLAVDPSLTVVSSTGRELAARIDQRDGPWGVLVLADGPDDDPVPTDTARALATATAALIEAGRSAEAVRHQIHRADALRRVAGEIGSRLDLGQILSGLVDHAMVLFDGDRAAVFLLRDGLAVAEVSRNLSSSYLAAVRDFPQRSLPALAAAAGRPMFATGYASDPRATDVHSAVVQEGFDTIATAPLFDGPELLGLLNVYHDRRRPWTDAELETMAALAAQAGIALKNAANFEQMATWAAQLQSIQQLGARLSRLSETAAIGEAIATELRQLIDYHNARVYRRVGDDLLPVAMRGQVGEYIDETIDQLKVRIGEGITGWVAEHRVAQYLPDAAADPRANTIPGTEDDLDESMLLAPMLYEDDVIGVLVLSKLGLHQFTDGDLRLLVIYASFAAQAFASADATERLQAQSAALERQLTGQRGLLKITESILATLDTRAVLDQVADRLSELVGYDNLSIEVLDRSTGSLRPLTAKGIHADGYLEPWLPGEEGLATWVVANNEPALVTDERNDPRVLHFREGPMDGSLMCIPLRGRDGAVGVLTLERLGFEHAFTDDEFELVTLFAAQVSIALQNAEAHQAVEIRAQTDDLTGLLNHGTFQQWLAGSVDGGEPFGLIMLDLDAFKLVNDRLGHQAGDRLLAEIATAIVAASRDSDHVFRYGGDEFALILPLADPAASLAVAQRVRDAIQALGAPGTTWNDQGVGVQGSIGVSTYPGDGETAEAVLLAADRASFVAKRSGHGLITTADEGLERAGERTLQEPTPVDPPTLPLSG